jgi:hypothetical protein
MLSSWLSRRFFSGWCESSAKLCRPSLLPLKYGHVMREAHSFGAVRFCSRWW